MVHFRLFFSQFCCYSVSFKKKAEEKQESDEEEAAPLVKSIPNENNYETTQDFIATDNNIQQDQRTPIAKETEISDPIDSSFKDNNNDEIVPIFESSNDDENSKTHEQDVKLKKMGLSLEEAEIRIEQYYEKNERRSFWYQLTNIFTTQKVIAVAIILATTGFCLPFLTQIMNLRTTLDNLMIVPQNAGSVVAYKGFLPIFFSQFSHFYLN